jgi:photosystem II stability/assembly factor-like uncharacterized protein
MPLCQPDSFCFDMSELPFAPATDTAAGQPCGHSRTLFRWWLAFLMAVLALTPLEAGPSTNWIVPFPTGRGPGYADRLPGWYSFQDRLLVSFDNRSLLASFDDELWTPSFAVTHGEFGPGRFLEDAGILYWLSWRGVMTSTNGLSWTSQSSAMGFGPISVAHGNGLFAALAQDPATYLPTRVYLSAEATEWTAHPLPAGVRGVSLAFVRDHFVLLSNSGAWLSADGTNWQHHAIAPRPGSSEESAAWSSLWCVHDRCFAAGFNGRTAPSVCALSEDGGVTWSPLELGGKYHINDLTYADGRYLVVGSSVKGSGVVGYSDDGRHWSFAPAPDDEVCVRVAHVNGRFVARTINKSTFSATDSVTYTSEDGVHWDSPNHGRHDLNAVTATATGFVAVGQHGTILTSPNGFDWRQEVSGTTNDLVGVGSGGGLIIATGSGDAILTSRDAHTWTIRPHPAIQPAADPAYALLYGVAHARGRYVIAGAYLSSTNGVDWEAPPGYDYAPANEVRVIVDDGQQFLSVNYGTSASGTAADQLGRSSDGRTWTFTPFSPGITSLAYGNGTYVAVGNGPVTVSTNGVDWQPLPRLTQLRSVIYADGEFVGVANDGTVGSSSDGLHWAYGQCPGRANAIAYRDGVYVAVGPRGMVYCSTPAGVPRLAQARWVPGYGFHLGLAGVPGRTYRVQYTADGQTWNDLATLQAPVLGTSLPADNLVRVLDPSATANSLRWYRAIEP